MLEILEESNNNLLDFNTEWKTSDSTGIVSYDVGSDFSWHGRPLAKATRLTFSECPGILVSFWLYYLSILLTFIYYMFKCISFTLLIYYYYLFHFLFIIFSLYYYLFGIVLHITRSGS